jgi:hypothetical protein
VISRLQHIFHNSLEIIYEDRDIGQVSLGSPANYRELRHLDYVHNTPTLKLSDVYTTCLKYESCNGCFCCTVFEEIKRTEKNGVQKSGRES